MNILFKPAKLILAGFTLVFAVLLSGCGSGCAPSGVNYAIVNSSCNSAVSTTSPTASTYDISGRINGSTLLGVTITLTGAGAESTTTDSNGSFSFKSLPNGSYNVVPSLTGNTFTPVSTAVTISNANVTGTNFAEVANSTAMSSLSGSVNGPVAQNVLMTLTAGTTIIGTAVTDATGSYSFAGVVAGTVTVAPSLAGYTFTPASTTVMPTIGGIVSGINFTEAPVQ